MPRSVRIEYEGAVYHVMCRGDRQEAIFLDQRDRDVFLETLAEGCERAGFRIHSYVLMTNHYHLLLETPEPNLVAGMQWFQGTYTARFNARQRKRGHVFQGRYKAIPVEVDEPDYFCRASDYIHLNPARAGMIDQATAEVAGYPWSSVAAFGSARSLPAWLVRARLFEALGLPDEGAQSRKRFVERLRLKARELWTPENELEGEWKALRRGWYMGGPKFREALEDRVEKSMKGKKRSSFSDEGLRRHDEVAAKRLLEQALKCCRLDQEQVKMLKKSDPRKQVMAWLMKTRTAVASSWIQDQLAMGDESNIRRAVLCCRPVPSAAHRKLVQRILHVCRD